MQSRPPSEQRVSGASLQMITRLSTTLGIATAIFKAVQMPLPSPRDKLLKKVLLKMRRSRMQLSSGIAPPHAY